LEQHLTLASLARPNTIIMSHEVYADLSPGEQAWCESFSHPILEDIDPPSSLHTIPALPAREAQLISEQAQVILGFNLAGARPEKRGDIYAE